MHRRLRKKRPCALRESGHFAHTRAGLARDREVSRALIVEQNKKNYASRVEAEAVETKVREKEVGKMERIEMALIQQLKNTQVIQQQAFEQLESALNGDV